MSSPLLVENKNTPELIETGSIVSVMVNIDLAKIDNNALFQELMKRGYFASSHDLESSDSEFLKFLYVRVLNIMSKYNNRQLESAAQDLECLIRDVFYRLKPDNQS